MPDSILIAIGQAHSHPGDFSGNFQLAVKWASEAAQKGAKLLLLPELFDSGYDLSQAKSGGTIFSGMGKVAEEQKITIVCGQARPSANGWQNSSVMVLPSGAQSSYAKIHLFEAEPNVESRVFEPGKNRASWEWEEKKATPLVCYDLRFPELARAGALAGSELFLVSSAWPASRREVFRVLCQARAIENQSFLLSANLAGRSSAGSFAGHSMVVAPDGSILAEAGEEEGLLFASLDFSLVEKARSHLPCFQQRRPGAY